VSSGNHALQRFLARLLSRSLLTAEEQRAILELPCRTSKVQARRDIVSPGETVDHACLVGKGIVARFDQMRDGQRQIAAFYIAGDMCDLHSVVAPVAGWGMSAMTASTLLFVPHASLRELVVRYPAIALAFWRDSTADASILAKWVGNLGRQDARARLAHLLCEFGTRFERAELGTRTCFMLDLTQEQIADAQGLTAVHVNRTIQRLRGEGVITTLNRTVEVSDWKRLVDIADFDPTYLLLNEPTASQRTPELWSATGPMV
jgi:CRP-like cAMP-binding protein